MALLDERDRSAATALGRLAYANPFLPERIDLERQALGRVFEPAGVVWSVGAEHDAPNPNVKRLAARAEEVAAAMHGRLRAGRGSSPADRALYEDVVLYALYARHEDDLYRLATDGEPGRVACWRPFAEGLRHFLGIDEAGARTIEDAPHLFATMFQVRRAFHHIFRSVVGTSLVAARLRAVVWQSLFTHDMRRYRRALYRRMHDVTTLVTGPSGTGKELVARAIALSRYVAFEPRQERFADDGDAFHALNLAALSPTLIESELFGHRRGAFTGALQDRAGWLEACGPSGTVFLDEIGELDVGLQVKLLRVLQSRTFQRIGDTTDRRFEGKLVAATNRDLAAAMRAGAFREDLYYRLCADQVTTPSLRDQLDDTPDDLGHLVRFIADRVVGPEEAAAVSAEVLAWIGQHLGRDYAWPGNVRELEQCVRNVVIRREYRPPEAPARTARDELAAAVRAGALTADELLARYCTLVFAETGSYLETARRLGLDRRTVKGRVDPELLARLRA